MRSTRNRLPTGTLRLRGSTWWAQWKHCGRPFAVSLGTKDRKDAKARFVERMSLVRASILDGSHAAKFAHGACLPSEDGDAALAAAWECFAASPRRPDCSPETLQQYEYQFGRFAEWADKSRPGVRFLSQVDEGVAEAFAACLEREVSPSTFNRYRDLLLMVFRVLRDRNGHSPANPWEAIQRKRAKNGHGRREFDDEELRRIFLTLQKRCEGIQLTWGEDGIRGERALGDHDRESAAEMLTVATLGLYTGLRMGDCCRLRWEEVDLARKAIVRRPSKTSRRSDRPVVVPVHPDLLQRLLAVRPDPAKGFVCPRKAEQYGRNKSDVSKRFSTLFRQCGILQGNVQAVQASEMGSVSTEA
jgi:integrase